MGEEILHNYIEFGEPKISFETIDKIHHIEPQTLRETERNVKSFF